jgi:hypothetical protein
MSARDEISDLVFAYAERIDAGDFEGVADLLAHADITAEGAAARTVVVTAREDLEIRRQVLEVLGG